MITMENSKDAKSKILPSTTRGGKELPSSLALDSPSVISKLATPKPATAIHYDMSHVIDDATSAMHDETTSVRDTTVGYQFHIPGKEKGFLRFKTLLLG